MKKIFKKNQIIITALALMIAVAGYLQYTGSKINDKSAAKEASSKLSEDTYEISDEDMFSADDIFTDTEDNSDASAQAGVDSSAGTQGADASAQAGTDASAQAGGADDAAAAGTQADGSVAGTGAADGTQMAEGENDIQNPGEAVLTSSSVGNLDFAAEMKLNREQVRSKNKETLLEVINNAGITEQQKQAAVDAMVALTNAAEREAAAEMLLEAKGFTDVVVSISDNNADVVLNMGDVTDAKRAQVEDIVKRKTNIAAENIVITPIQPGAGTGSENPQAGGENAAAGEETAPEGENAAQGTEE